MPSLKDAGFRTTEARFSMEESNSGCRLACLLRWSDRMNRLSQMGQQNRFSPGKIKNSFVRRMVKCHREWGVSSKNGVKHDNGKIKLYMK